MTDKAEPDLDVAHTPSVEAGDVAADLMKRVERLAGHRPTVGILGKTGAGKSRLGNALFGRDVFKVSDVRAGTRAPKPLTAAIFGVDMTLVDLPGVGESASRDEEYRELYRSWMNQIDVALWMVKMDDRALAADQDCFERVIKPSGFPIDRIVFVSSQIEKAEPLQEWNYSHGRPGPNQLSNIAEKAAYLAEVFNVPVSQIASVSADQRYNLVSLAERIVDACPAEAALNVARALENDLKSETVKETVVKKLWSLLKTFYDKHEDRIHDLLAKIVAAYFEKRISR